MEQWIRKLNKFNIYYKQFSFGGRRRKVVAIVMEVPNNTLELAAEAMKLQKQVRPHDGPPSPCCCGVTTPRTGNRRYPWKYRGPAIQA